MSKKQKNQNFKNLGFSFGKRNDIPLGRSRKTIKDTVGNDLLCRNTVTKPCRLFMLGRTKRIGVIGEQTQFIIIPSILDNSRNIFVHLVPASIGTPEILLHGLAVVYELLLNKIADQMVFAAHFVATHSRLGHEDLPKNVQNGVL